VSRRDARDSRRQIAKGDLEQGAHLGEVATGACLARHRERPLLAVQVALFVVDVELIGAGA
jgi:hypothetical protein